MSQPATGMPGPSRPRVRAADADREAVVATLHDAVVRGLLTMDEAEERLATTYAARFLDELPPITADLPPAPEPAAVARGWRPLLVLAWLQLRAALAGFSWRGTGRAVRSRPRLAVAAVAMLALLAFGVAVVGDGFDHGPGVEHGRQQLDRG